MGRPTPPHYSGNARKKTFFFDGCLPLSANRHSQGRNSNELRWTLHGLENQSIKCKQMGLSLQESKQTAIQSKGRVQKNSRKSVVFYQIPLGLPPGLAFFRTKNLTPIFLLKITSVMAETNFTLGPASKTNKFHLSMQWSLFVQNQSGSNNYSATPSQQFLKLHIYPINFRPSVKHVLGVLE